MDIVEVSTQPRSARSLMPSLLKALAGKEDLQELVSALPDEDFIDLVIVVNKLLVVEENRYPDLQKSSSYP